MVVVEGALHALANSLQRREVDDGVDLVLGAKGNRSEVTSMEPVLREQMQTRVQMKLNHDS